MCILVRSRVCDVLAGHALLVVLSLCVALGVWFTGACTGRGRARPCPPADGTGSTHRGWRGLCLLTSDSSWTPCGGSARNPGG